MADSNFLKKWNRLELLKALPSSRKKFKLDKKSIEFLFDIGLPNDVLELSFDYLTEDLETVNETWKIGEEEFNKYVNIGFNGSGDPVVINLENGEIVYLNHDDGFKEIFINADIEKFAHCGLEIIEFQDNLKKFRPESYYDTEFTDEQLEKLKHNLSEIDQKIFERDTHWHYTIQQWIWEREEERKKY